MCPISTGPASTGLVDGELVLGPFQGKPACIRIPIGKGVCGAAAERRETQLVADVFAFPGHIACDAASRSEMVVPIVTGDRLIGVLDLDSPSPARFDGEDAAGCEAIAARFSRRGSANPDWPNPGQMLVAGEQGAHHGKQPLNREARWHVQVAVA